MEETFKTVEKDSNNYIDTPSNLFYFPRFDGADPSRLNIGLNVNGLENHNFYAIEADTGLYLRLLRKVLRPDDDVQVKVNGEHASFRPVSSIRYDDKELITEEVVTEVNKEVIDTLKILGIDIMDASDRDINLGDENVDIVESDPYALQNAFTHIKSQHPINKVFESLFDLVKEKKENEDFTELIDLSFIESEEDILSEYQDKLIFDIRESIHAYTFKDDPDHPVSVLDLEGTKGNIIEVRAFYDGNNGVGFDENGHFSGGDGYRRVNDKLLLYPEHEYKVDTIKVVTKETEYL